MSKFEEQPKALAAWYERQKRVLPWRDQPTLYRVWISEIMLQQTQVATVVPFFERFMAQFPTVQALSQASDEAVMQAWAGLGYYSRARNLHRASKTIAETDFPRTKAGWLEIPGVGPYTAGAITSIALNHVEPILDGNVERVLSRMKAISLQGAEFKAALWKESEKWVRRGAAISIEPRTLNQALMELGARVCTFRQPRCAVCPLKKACRALRQGDPTAFPPKKKRKEWVKLEESVLCLIDQENRVFLEKNEGEWRRGLWDLPAQWPAVALKKRSERLAEMQTRYVVTRHRVSRKTAIHRVSSKWTVSETDRQRWVNPFEQEVPLGAPVRKILKQITDFLSE